jgi:hypothetical protein
MTREGRRGEYQPEATVSVGDVRDHPIDHRVSAGDERLLAQAHARIVEDPHAEMLVWHNDVDGVHGDPCARTKRNPDQSKGGRLSRGLQLALFEALLSRRLGGCRGMGVSRRKGLLAQATLPTGQRLSVTASTFWSISKQPRPIGRRRSVSPAEPRWCLIARP